MKRFKKILVYIEGPRGEPALAQAARLAKRNRAALRVVHVSKKLPEYAHMLTSSVRVDDLYSSTAASTKDWLEEFVAPIREDGIDVTTHSLHGTPFLEVIHEVKRGRHDLVIKATGEEGWFKERFFGATDLHLLRKCPCPVWIVKPKESPKFERVLAAVDTGSKDSEHAGLSRKILELGSSLAETQGAEFHAMHCWERVEEGSFGPVKWVPMERIREALEEAKHKVQAAFQDALSDFAPTAIHFLEGAPGRLIPQFVEENRVDLLVMGTVGRTGVPGFFIGNTAEQVLAQVECSVLAVKPDGFVSPVLVAGDT